MTASRSWLTTSLLASFLATSRVWGDEVKVWAEPNPAEVGESFLIRMQASSSEVEPTHAEPGSPPGTTVTGSNLSPSRMVTIINGTRSEQIVLNGTWSILAGKVGSYTFSPTVQYGRERIKASPVIVRIVPKGEAPRRAAPADPFSSFFGRSPFDDFFDAPTPFALRPAVTPDPNFSMEAPRGSVLFLHSAVDKRSAVVGEQITLSVYLYFDPDAREPEMSDPHEVTAADFLRRPLRDENGQPPLVAHANVGGQLWRVHLLRKLALFPLKAGTLSIGPMSLSLRSGRGLSPRESEPLAIRVSEPPVAGRPGNYLLGDVGDWKVTANVFPREIRRGDAISVDVEVSGTGNLPTSLTPPAQQGLEWLPPEIHEKLGSIHEQRYGGQRKFSYVVRGRKEGDYDLGVFTLSFFSPEKRKYETLRADLGKIRVLPGASLETPEEPHDFLPGLPNPKTVLGPTIVAPPYPTDRAWYLWWLVSPTLTVLGFSGTQRIVRRVRQTLGMRRTSPRSLLRDRMADAERLARGADGAALDAATIHALEAAIFAHLGVHARGLQRHELAGALQSANFSRERIETATALLSMAEAARFAPTSAEISDARARWQKAAEWIAELSKKRQG